MSEEKTAELEKRVMRLETYFLAGLIVAAFFGLGAGVGAKLIKDSRNEISELQANASSLSDRLVSLQTDVLQAQDDLSTVVPELERAAIGHANSLQEEASKHLGTIALALRNAKEVLSNRSSAEQAAIGVSVNREIEARFSDFGSIGVHEASKFPCDARGKPATGGFTEICRHRVRGDFPEGFTVMYSVPYFYSRAGEIPPVYSVHLEEVEGLGFDIVVRTAYSQLNEMIVQYLVLSAR